MASESSIILPVLVAVVVDVLSGAVIKPATASPPPPPPSGSTYIQSDSTNYFQPDGSSLYLIP